MATSNDSTQFPLPTSMSAWQSAWQSDFDTTAQALLAAQAARLDALSHGQAPEWISLTPLAELRTAIETLRQHPGSALWGVPFAVKDNIDVAGLPTTAGCVEFAYNPTADAGAVALLTAAGALCLGKTNLDQFATGLNGTRSPYGVPHSVFSAAHISGGSSSGSAVVVAQGDAVFALGTDTAGSGRVPAAFNELIGVKPSKGWVSTQGVVPACRSLDCVSVFARSLADADAVLRVIGHFDAADPYARPAPPVLPRLTRIPKLATFSNLNFFGDAQQESAWHGYRNALVEQGFALTEIDPAPFLALAPLLYGGPWVAERTAAIEDFLLRQPAAIHPVVRGIIEQGKHYSEIDSFKAEYHRAALARQIAEALAPFDALLLPTSPIFPTIDAVQAEPCSATANWAPTPTSSISRIYARWRFPPVAVPMACRLVSP